MKRIVAVVLATLVSAGAAAADTYRFGSQVVSVGDSEGKLLQVAGQPAIRTPIESRGGGLSGYRLEYVQKGKSVQIEIVNGRIDTITQIDD